MWVCVKWRSEMVCLNRFRPMFSVSYRMYAVSEMSFHLVASDAYLICRGEKTCSNLFFTPAWPSP